MVVILIVRFFLGYLIRAFAMLVCTLWLQGRWRRSRSCLRFAPNPLAFTENAVPCMVHLVERLYLVPDPGSSAGLEPDMALYRPESPCIPRGPRLLVEASKADWELCSRAQQN